MTRHSRDPRGAPAGQLTAVDRGSRASRFIRLAIALHDLLAAAECLKQVSQPGTSLSLAGRQALRDAMVTAYGRLFPRCDLEPCGLPSQYEPAGALRTTHLHLLGMRNLMHQHGESSRRRVLVGPASTKSTGSHVAPGGWIVWSVRQDPLGHLDLQEVDSLFQHLRDRLHEDAGQILAELFAGRAIPLSEVAMEDA